MTHTHTPPLAKLSKYAVTTAATVLLGLSLTSISTNSALAGIGTLFDASSRVDTAIAASPAGGGLTRYSYTLTNTSTGGFGGDASESETILDFLTFDQPLIVDWELPYFADANIVNIISPTGWAHNIETVGMANAATGWDGVASWQNPLDPFHFPNSPFNAPGLQVLHWYSTLWAASLGGTLDLTDALDLGDSLAGFSIDSPIVGSVDAPYQASWAFIPVVSGDPPLPGSPSFGLPASPNALGIPEPGAALLFGFGLAGLALMRRRRKA